MAFGKFMSGLAGRGIRVVVGIALIVVGLVALQASALGIILAAVGLLMLVAGVANFCVFAPLFGGKFMGKEYAA